MIGLTSDAGILVNNARIYSQQYRFTYNEPQPVEQLVTRVCDVKQAYTMYGGKLGLLYCSKMCWCTVCVCVCVFYFTFTFTYIFMYFFQARGLLVCLSYSLVGIVISDFNCITATQVVTLLDGKQLRSARIIRLLSTTFCPTKYFLCVVRRVSFELCVLLASIPHYRM